MDGLKPFYNSRFQFVFKKSPILILLSAIVANMLAYANRHSSLAYLLVLSHFQVNWRGSFCRNKIKIC